MNTALNESTLSFNTSTDGLSLVLDGLMELIIQSSLFSNNEIITELGGLLKGETMRRAFGEAAPLIAFLVLGEEEELVFRFFCCVFFVFGGKGIGRSRVLDFFGFGDSQGSVVYVLVDMLKMHLRYEANAEIEESVGVDLQRLYREGNEIIKARKKRKRNREDDDSDVQIPDSEEDEDEDEEEDVNVFNV